MVDQNALLVLQKRYLIKDETGTSLETPEGLFNRVAGFIARAEDLFKGGQRGRTEAAFQTMLSNLEFLPNSPTVMNAGRDLGQLAACFVLPIEDSPDSIFEKVRETALIHRTGEARDFLFPA